MCFHLPTRAGIAFMVFTACAISYMLRVNISINIIAMARQEGNSSSNDFACKRRVYVSDNDTGATFQRLIVEDPEDQENAGYDWTSQTQGVILSSYFWGQILSCAPGGLIAEKFGPTRTIFFSTIAGATFNFLIPLVAEFHWVAVAGLRFLMGLMGGVVYPSLHCLISRWAPPEEKGKFVGALLGGSLGTVLTWPLLGLLIETWGWPWAFFVPAIIAAIWSWLWNVFVSDTPALHKHIKEVERAYIEDRLKGTVVPVGSKKLPPYGRIFTSLAAWALIVAHFGNAWGLFFLMTSGPKYMSTVLGFNLSGSGFLSALPYLARMLFGIVFGFIGDAIRKQGCMGTTGVRKTFTVCSHLMPGILLFLLTATECDVVWSIALITFSLGLNGASTITNLANSQDLTPSFAGSMYGIINTIGTATGFISPLINGYITRENNGIPEWRLIFFISGSIYILSGFCFIVFGSGENQHWDESKEKPESLPGKAESGIDNLAFEKEKTQNKDDNQTDNKNI